MKDWGYFSRSGQGLSARDDVDAIGRAGRGTKETSHAFYPALLVAIQPMHAPIDDRIGYFVSFLGRLDRYFAAEQMAQRSGQTVYKKQ